MTKRLKRPPGVIFPEKGGYTKTEYGYYEYNKEQAAKRDGYVCLDCGFTAPFKVEYGCKKWEGWSTDGINRHPTGCPLIPSLPKDQLKEDVKMINGKERLLVYWRKGCHQCENRIKLTTEKRDISWLVGHHIDGNPFNNHYSNIKTLCRSCNHRKENTKRGKNMLGTKYVTEERLEQVKQEILQEIHKINEKAEPRPKRKEDYSQMWGNALDIEAVGHAKTEAIVYSNMIPYENPYKEMVEKISHNGGSIGMDETEYIIKTILEKIHLPIGLSYLRFYSAILRHDKIIERTSGRLYIIKKN